MKTVIIHHIRRLVAVLLAATALTATAAEPVDMNKRAGFTVDAFWKNGKLGKANITSENGGKSQIRANAKIQSVTISTDGKQNLSL